MNHATGKRVPWGTLALAFYAITWFYLLLYFCGVLDVQRYGAVYALALLAATLIAGLTSPYRASTRQDDAPATDAPPRPPRFPAYVAIAAVSFVALWLGLRLLEWVSVQLTGASRWPVSSLSGVLASAAVAVAGAVVLALLHRRAYRKLASGTAEAAATGDVGPPAG